MSGSDYRNTEFDTARLSASERDQAHRAEQRAIALRVLERKGEDLVAVILGLTPEMCAGGCGAEAVRMGYCDARACKAALRREAKRLGDSAYRAVCGVTP